MGSANGLLRATSSTGLVSALWRTTGSRWVLTERLSYVGSDFRNGGVLTQELARGFSAALIARIDANAALGRGWTIDAGGRHERYRTNQILRDFVTINNGTAVRVRNEREVTAVDDAARRLGASRTPDRDRRNHAWGCGSPAGHSRRAPA